MGPRHPHEPALLATVFLLNCIEFLQAGMLAFGGIPLLGEIGAGPEEYTLVTAAYAVAAIGAIGLMGWCVERAGWRRFLCASVALFVAGAAVCATSTGLPQFLVGRIVMGLGGGVFMTAARLLINLMPASPRRFLGIKAFASALTLGNAAAPWLAAQCIGAGHWQLMFVILSILAVGAALVAAPWLPAGTMGPEQGSRAHALPLAVLLAGCGAGLYTLQRAQYAFFRDDAWLAAGVGGAAAAIGWFAWHQARAVRPLLVTGRLVQPRYLAGLAIFTLCYAALGANNYVLPQFVQRALGQPWQAAGGVQSAGLLAALPAFWAMALVISRDPSPRKFYVAGCTALAVAGVLLGRLHGGAHLWSQVLPAVACYGVFIILVMAPTALHAFAGLQQDEQAFANGQQVKNMLAQFGIAAGSALAALTLQQRGSAHYTVLGERLREGDAAFAAVFDPLAAALSPHLGAAAGPAALGQLAQALVQQAALLASLDYFHALAVAGLAGAVLLRWQKVLR